MLAQRENVVAEDKSSEILNHLDERLRCIHENMTKLQMKKDIQEATCETIQACDILSSILQDIREALSKDKQNLMLLTDSTAQFGCH